MLLAVEGGGFFSSSASGYSKGLTLLLLGQKDEDDQPMKVSQWNQYQLVDHEHKVRLGLGSRRKWLTKSFLSLICFSCPSQGDDESSHSKDTRADQQDIWPDPHVSDECHVPKADLDDATDTEKPAPRSNLRRRSSADAVPVSDSHDVVPGQIGGRRVQWTDALGTELFEIREFEPSEIGKSEDECKGKNER
ncbi:hypothetical protein SAY86_005800 [Trapa natans]|uniref:Uncharacterized protein n=1 Tax=Trapa natans TaxID=22666 RepID=A0AAN7L9Y8_TRANT|nr:hypothetical protein SAY86_005800 [Trapa natans]